MSKIYFLIFFLITIISCSKEVETPVGIFENLSAQQIIELEPSMSDDLINSTNGERNDMPSNTILVFRTGNGNYGKMLILNNTEEAKYLEFRYDLYNHKKEQIMEANFTSVSWTYTFDFETNTQGAPSKDFWWEWNQFNGGGQDGEDKFLVPRGNCIFSIYLN